MLHRRIHRLVVTHRDRLSRFSAEIIFTLCELQNVEVILTHKGAPPTLDKEEPARDVRNPAAV